MTNEHERAAIEAAASSLAEKACGRNVRDCIVDEHCECLSDAEKAIAAYLAAGGGREGRVAAWRLGAEAGANALILAPWQGNSVHGEFPDPTPEELP